MSDTELKLLAITAILTPLGLVTLLATVNPGGAELAQKPEPVKKQKPLDTSDRLFKQTTPLLKGIKEQQAASPACQPGHASKLARAKAQATQAQSQAPINHSLGVLAVGPSYTPRQAKALIHPTNYGERFTRDIYGKPLTNQYIVVLHETVGPVGATIRFFQTPHYKDEEQVSYHALITLDGTIVYLMPPGKRAFGAGSSVFNGPLGRETVKTKLQLPPSVNNFAYHIALETPADGNNNNSRHSGYTTNQYQSLAWLTDRTKVPDSRITTHQAIDQSGERQDPRSFDFQKFLALLHSHRANLNNQCAEQL